jgi:hypothetical protein
VQKQVGCPLPKYGISTTFAVQHFEHGHMIHQTTRSEGSHGSVNIYKAIYVIYDDGTAQRFADNYAEGDVNPTPEPAPSGLVTPVLGFGKVWREQPQVRERLGWATAPEFTPEDADWAFFEYGMMVYSGAQDDNVFVLFDGSGLNGVIDSGAVYPGAYRP